MTGNLPQEGNDAPFNGASSWLYAMRHVFRTGNFSIIKCLRAGDILLEIIKGPQTLWLKAGWEPGGGLAVRLTYTPDGEFQIESCREFKDGVEYSISAAIGSFDVRVEVPDPAKPLVHFTTHLRPEGELNVPFWPSDLYPIDASGDPLNTKGIVHAGQRGYAAGLVHATLTEPRSGSFLYFQDLSSLNDYCQQTHTVPENRVGGSWPELGYTLPIAERKPLLPDQDIVISDGYLVLTHEMPESNGEVARSFLDMLAEVYLLLPRPGVEYRDWPGRAEAALRDLDNSPACTTRVDGKRYLNGYVGTGERRPENMVQLTVLTAMLDYADWTGDDITLAGELKDGLSAFFDPDTGSLMRYPRSRKDDEPDDMDEKENWEVDSWYLYHPLINLAKLALRGDEEARHLLSDSLEFVIDVAHRFDYKWPILFDARDLSVIKAKMAPEVELGEADVAGLYAYLMHTVWQVLGEDIYLKEAGRALDSLDKLRFNIAYQFNNTAWTANAAMHLWRATGKEAYLDLSHQALASILHNTMLWECRFGHAGHYGTFFGLMPLREGFYLAMYEEYEVFAAFQEYLAVAEGRLPASLEMLLAEYCRHTLSRTWSYYPTQRAYRQAPGRAPGRHLSRVDDRRPGRTGSLRRRGPFRLCVAQLSQGGWFSLPALLRLPAVSHRKRQDSRNDSLQHTWRRQMPLLPAPDPPPRNGTAAGGRALLGKWV